MSLAAAPSILRAQVSVIHMVVVLKGLTGSVRGSKYDPKNIKLKITITRYSVMCIRVNVMRLGCFD